MSVDGAKVVILAAGLGRRMRRGEPGVQLARDQATVAGTGVKALIPVGRPFLDYVLTRVADAGCRDVCLVIGPRHDEIRSYYEHVQANRLRIVFAVQDEPLGTAHALAAAEQFVGDDPFLVLNSDNCYPANALRGLCRMEGCGIVGFDRETLIAGGDMAAERILQFAIVEPDSEGWLKRILEKPPPHVVERMQPPILVSMNCWRFEPVIFQACRRIGKSPRGEYEIPDAVTQSIRVLGQRYRVLDSHEAVLDLSCQGDIARVARRLAGEDVRL